MPSSQSFLEQASFGPSSPTRSCVILDQHSGTEAFLQDFPQLLQAIECPEPVFLRYLAVERDAGARAVALRTAEAAAALAGDTRFEVLSVTYPRAVIEPQYLHSSQAVKGVFDHARHPELAQSFRAIHAGTQAAVESRLAELRPALVIDMHTMAPFCPEKNLPPTPTTVEGRLHDFLRARQGGRRRLLDVISGRAGQEGPRSGRRLTVNMKEALTGEGIAWAENVPYANKPGINTDAYYKDFQALALDIPKDYLTTIDAKDPLFDLADPPLDDLKIDRLAAVFASAIARSLAP